MDTLAVVLEEPKTVSRRTLALNPMTDKDILVEIAWSGISTGTEKLLWSGAMPAFPGMGYPLVPGYESVGRVVDAGAESRGRIGEWVFVPGANCYVGARALFGGAASHIVLPAARALTVPEALGADAVLMALAATALHAIADGPAPELIVGHGILGRLMARILRARGEESPVVWEADPARRVGDFGYAVIDPAHDERRDYRVIVDASGAADLLDTLIARLARGGEIVLAGFYDRIAFAFPPAFMREARLRVAAEFTPEDLQAVRALVAAGALRLDGLVSHICPATEAADAYPLAFGGGDCLKMVLDWRHA
ncbi:MAG: chlorophyll synthesis pathway protein BchC [Sphingomonas sp.]|uniref:chlorophyll synthesis pathway protein BchC n=1 Tax=Sphingomonas sp. TaxID=28214 RepID=UPI000DB304A8|nr:chlorophyll synthesis pathway protein BchC [Zymomonas sp.]MBA4772725.1 chlorophyll synthesis pathway protein BchC [Sphingomonas sp.]PZP18397.1 MAG: chlorophyll synthesis pathway protein BchC [Sphingomonas hengshuiensis]